MTIKRISSPSCSNESKSFSRHICPILCFVKHLPKLYFLCVGLGSKKLLLVFLRCFFASDSKPCHHFYYIGSGQLYNTGLQKKTLAHQLPVLFLQTLLYTFLVSVSPGTKKFSQKLVLKFKNSSHSAFLKSKR